MEKTLKEELQEILDGDLLNNVSRYICANLNNGNIIKFRKYREMSKNYAKEFVNDGDSWWRWLDCDDRKFVISEKYRFIKDLIAIL